MDTDIKTEIKTLSHLQETLVDMGLRFGPRLLVALLFIVAGYFCASWVGRATNRGLLKFQLEPPVRQLLVRLVHIAIMAVFVMMALQNLGIELLPLIAGVGVAGAGLALATQGVLSNVVAGLTIIFTRPYRVGECIAIVGVEGTVEAITVFSTVLAHSDRSRIVVPNRKIVGEILHNYGAIRQIEVRVNVAQAVDLPQTLRTLGELVTANPRVLAEPAPLVLVQGITDSVIQLVAKPWVKVQDAGVAESELQAAILPALLNRGITLPARQFEVRLLETGASRTA